MSPYQQISTQVFKWESVWKKNRKRFLIVPLGNGGKVLKFVAKRNTFTKALSYSENHTLKDISTDDMETCKPVHKEHGHNATAHRVDIYTVTTRRNLCY